MKDVCKTLAAGRFPCGNVRVSWNPKPRSIPEAINRQIEQFWKREILDNSAKQHLFNGDLCRLDDWSVSGKDLTLNLGYTNYKELLYSNRYATELDADVIAYALGISVVLGSCDDQIILMYRSDQVGEFPGKLDVFGGHVHPKEHAVQGVPDPFLGICDEIKEEINLSMPAESITCIGLIETRLTRKPEMIFTARADLTGKEIFGRATAHNSFEIDRLLAVSADDMESFVATNKQNFSPSAFGACQLYLERRN